MILVFIELENTGAALMASLPLPLFCALTAGAALIVPFFSPNY